jgi:hypothetical protein
VTTDRNLIRTARENLTDPELDVWLAKHIHGYGRRAGSLALGITEEAWRYRLTSADRKVAAALDCQEDTAA